MTSGRTPNAAGRGTMRGHGRRVMAGAIVAAMVAAIAPAAQAQIAVGAKADLRHTVLAHVTARYLTAQGIAATVRPGFSAPTLWGAQRDGVVDVAWESLGIALTTRADMPIATARDLSRDESLDRLRKRAADGPIAWAAAAPARGGPVIAVRADTAEAMDKPTIAALLRRLRRDEAARFGITTGFAGRPDGIRALADAAPPRLAYERLRRLRSKALLPALGAGRITAASLPRNDARVHADDLVHLRDDAGAFPNHSLAVAVRRDAMAEHPELADTLRRLAETIDGAGLRRLTRAARHTESDPAAAAEQFLRDVELLGVRDASRTGRLTSDR